MRQEWVSRKRHPRSILPVTLFASMSACSFQVGKASISFSPFPRSSCMRCLAVRNPDVGSLPPKGLNWRLCFPGYVSRLTRKGMSVRKLFKEYHSEYPDGLQLSSFKRAVRQYKFHIKVVGHVEHYAADQMYVDFAGDRLEVVDEMTGETKKAEVFVAILPFSHYTYCEAVWSQRKEDLIKGCENAMLYFEGAPAAIVPDNLKAAVTRSDRNEPVINDDFAAFAEYYGCAVYPARVRHPKDKALVENAVKLLYRSVYPDIEGMTFSSLNNLNAAIHVSLNDFNEKVMAGREAPRKEMFLRGEKGYLRPLPLKRYVMKEKKLMTVGRNSYVSLFKHHYSAFLRNMWGNA